MIAVKAGYVPGTLVELKLLNETPHCVLDVLRRAAEEIGQKHGLGKPAFEVSTEEYTNDRGQLVIDVPQKNGVILADKVGDRWENVRWDETVKDLDIVLIVPRIQGNR